MAAASFCASASHHRRRCRHHRVAVVDIVAVRSRVACAAGLSSAAASPPSLALRLRLAAAARSQASPRRSTIGRGIYFGHFRLKKLRLHRSAAKKSRQRLWHDDAASARFQPSSGRGRRSRWRAPPRSVGEFVCSWGHHSGRHALALLRCDGSAATKTSWRCAPSRGGWFRLWGSTTVGFDDCVLLHSPVA